MASSSFGPACFSCSHALRSRPARAACFHCCCASTPPRGPGGGDGRTHGGGDRPPARHRSGGRSDVCSIGTGSWSAAATSSCWLLVVALPAPVHRPGCGRSRAAGVLIRVSPSAGQPQLQPGRNGEWRLCRSGCFHCRTGSPPHRGPAASSCNPQCWYPARADRVGQR